MLTNCEFLFIQLRSCVVGCNMQYQVLCGDYHTGPGRRRGTSNRNMDAHHLPLACSMHILSHSTDHQLIDARTRHDKLHIPRTTN